MDLRPMSEWLIEGIPKAVVTEDEMHYDPENQGVVFYLSEPSDFIDLRVDVGRRSEGHWIEPLDYYTPLGFIPLCDFNLGELE